MANPNYLLNKTGLEVDNILSSAETHVADSNKHVTSQERTNWNAAKTHADSTHAPSNAEANQNAFSNITVGSTTIAADSKTDTLTLAGSNVTLTPDATNDKVTIGITQANVKSALGYTPANETTVSNLSTLVGDAAVSEQISDAIANKSDVGHTHNYAGSSSAGGSATSAVKATQDASGNVITSTYATKSELNSVSNLVGDTAVSTQITNAITAQKGKSSGLAELDSKGKVPSSQLPSYVDDVIEGYLSSSKFYKTKSGSTYSDEISGEDGKIYIDLDTNKTYRWAGASAGFVVISETIALGETSSTAYRGDRGKIAYDHSQSTHARTDATKTEKSSTNGNIKINGTETVVYTHPSGTNPHGTTKSDVGLGNVGNFKAVSTVASQGLTDTEKSNARANIGAGTSSFSGSYNDLTNKPTVSTTTAILLAANWNSNTKIYSFEADYPSTKYDIEIEINGDSCTDEQLEAWIAAKPLASSTNKINARGDLPSIDIPVIITTTYNPKSFPYLSFIGNEDFTLKVYGGSKGWDGIIEYSTDALTWNTWEDSTTISSSNNVLYLRGIGNTKISDSMPTYSFKFTGTDTLKIACEGNIENLLDYETVRAGGHPTMADYCYNNLFANCKYLTIAPELPATKLSNYCYQNMFKGCTSLTTAPELPATVMYNSCYSNMFKNCTSLTTIPSLPATTLANSYTSMFNGCTNIKLSTEQIGEYQTPYRIPTSGTGVLHGTKDLTDMFANTGGTFTGTPEINTTYYTSNTVV